MHPDAIEDVARTGCGAIPRMTSTASVVGVSAGSAIPSCTAAIDQSGCVWPSGRVGSVGSETNLGQPAVPRTAKGLGVSSGGRVQLETSSVPPLEQYDQGIERLGLLPGGPTAVEQSVPLGDQDRRRPFRVIDVWDSREAFEGGI